LLVRAEAAEGHPRRGRLKIFFGMCAGVGKTYAMLSEAQERRRGGADLVAGTVETHGRSETEALLEGLERLPEKVVEYRGVRLRELDLDAALRRRPALLLVDELAHTNVEGCRHAKRWQDVEELLDSGIDVHTTLNVQHIESLNDVVARVTGVPVRETVPDSIVERADEIELVDLPPDDLLQRLAEGKVYVPEQARRAVERFFRRDNLVALRELALRQTAERVGAQVLLERAGRGDKRPWATSERILVCVGPSPLSARVIRTARRMAASAQAAWMAISVETPRQSRLAATQVRRNLNLAERLGADTAVLSGESIVDEILAFAVRRNVTKIVVGKPALPRWRELLSGSIVDDLIRKGGDIDVHVVKGGPDDEPRPVPGTRAAPGAWREYGFAALVMGVCTMLAWLLHDLLSPVNLTMIYLAGVVLVATRASMRVSAFGSVLAAMLFDFMFTQPYFSFAISDAQYLIACVVLLITALVISGLMQRVRRQSEAARARYLRTAALYFMSRQLAGAADPTTLAGLAAQHIADVFHGETVILAPGSAGMLSIMARWGGFDAGAANERAAAQWVFDRQKRAGWGTDTLPASQAIYLPLAASGQALGVLALRPAQREPGLDADQLHLLDTFASQLGGALQRAALTVQAESARREVEAEQTRSALLSCVSHDLRTPLAAISGAASTMLEGGDRLAEDTRHELLQSIADESGRLNHLVGKLLDMTRLDSAGFKLQKDWYPLEEIVGSALTRVSAMVKDHDVHTKIPDDLPVVRIDGPLVEQVLTNMVENAAHYTPAGSQIVLQARTTGQELMVEVLDNGPGLEPGTERQIFRRFVRARPSEDRRGTGLGLAICQAVVRLHGGQIGAGNRPEGGARFWFTLPVDENAPTQAAWPDGATSVSARRSGPGTETAA
jgi:two-component system sensor histidine kinase KdpD